MPKIQWTELPPALREHLFERVRARRVREIFELYLTEHSLVGTARILNERGWRTKTWTTKSGATHEGTPFGRVILIRLGAAPSALQEPQLPEIRRLPPEFPALPPNR